MENKHFKRKNPRLINYDYTSRGYYFITICTKDKVQHFGKILKEEMQLNEFGKIAEKNLEKIQKVYDTIKIDKYVIMPNHIHLILVIDKGNNLSISNIIKKYKEWITKESGKSFWQKSFHDHIIRNEKDYLRIWEYIDENVLRWSLDMYYSE